MANTLTAVLEIGQESSSDEDGDQVAQQPSNPQRKLLDALTSECTY